MNRATSIASLFLICFLVMFPDVRSADGIVQETCKKIAARDKRLNFDFCVKSLGSDPESHGVDLKGLGLIGVKLLQANLTGITEYTKQLLKEKKVEPGLLKSLSACSKFYSLVQGKDMVLVYKGKDYVIVGRWASSVMSAENYCDTQMSGKKGMVPPLTTRNADVFQLSVVLAGILNIL